MTGPDEPQDPHYPHYPDQPGPQPGHPQPYPQPGYGDQQPYQQPYQQQPSQQPYQQPYGQYPPPGGPPARSATLAERAARRPEPRFGVSLAGAGIALIIVGILAWGGDYVSSGSGGVSNGGGSHKVLGIVLSLVVVAAGYVVAVRAGRGPLATGGVVASALGIPVLLAFLTLGSGSDNLPFSLDAVAIVSILAWVITYLAVPGARGHAFLLATATVLLWLYLIIKVEPKLFTIAFFFPQIAALSGGPISAPDFTDLGSASLVLGLVYFAIAFGLDRTGRHGTATAFVVGGFPAIDVGVAALSPDLKQIGAGLVAIALGVVLGTYGARYGRRFTTWVSASSVAFGLILLVAKVTSDNNAVIGITLIIVGCIVVAAGAATAKLLREPDDLTPRAGVPG